jgi:hypothetical protein
MKPAKHSTHPVLCERLRQERATFDQRRQQDAHWFALRIAMGFASLILLPIILAVCGWIVLNPGRFSDAVVVAASAALFVKTIGLLIGVWKLVIRPAPRDRLQPVTVAAEVRRTDGTSNRMR